MDDSVVTATDIKEQTNHTHNASTTSSQLKLRFINAGLSAKNSSPLLKRNTSLTGERRGKKKPLLVCNSSLVLTMQDRQVAQAESMIRYFGLMFKQQQWLDRFTLIIDYRFKTVWES